MLALMWRLVLALLCSIALLGCGAGGAHPARASAVPATDGDPLPFTPPPEPEGHTDRTVALAASGGEDQARQMLPVLLRAARDGDQHQLEQILLEEVVMLQGRGDRPLARPRSSFVEHLMHAARRSVIQTDVEVEEMVDLTTVRVSRAAEHYQGRSLPTNVRATDVVLDVNLLEAGRAPLRMLFLWQMRGRIIVRPGRDPRVVAL